MRNKKGFTLIELMVVILIVGILAAVAVPIMRGRVDSAKWSEAAATAGTIKTAVRATFAEDTTAVSAGDNLGTATVRSALQFFAGDLEGTYFTAADFTVTAIDGNGNATVEAVGSKAVAPGGTGTLSSAGWVVVEP